MLYMVTFTINIPPMLAYIYIYIPAPWILWVISDRSTWHRSSMASPGTCNLQTCHIDPVRHQVRQRTCLKEHQRGQKTRRPLSSVCIVCWFVKLYKPHEYYIYIYTHSFIYRYRIHYSSSGSSWVFVSSHHGHGCQTRKDMSAQSPP